jgi:DEAD/DEAH box helicase domain-containing protein
MQHLVYTGAMGLESLQGYWLNQGKSFLLNRLSFGPKVGPSSPRPKCPAMAKGEGYEPLVTANTAKSWYEDWLSCLNPDAIADRKQLEHVLAAGLDVLCAVGLLQRKINERGIAL